jgi:hypothetical protein
LRLNAHILPCLKKDSAFRMTSAAYEGIGLSALVLGSTDNTMLAKVILALSAVASEMDFLMSDDQGSIL